MRRFSGLAAVLMMLAIAAPATAASTRYASPSGSGTTCSASTPCDVTTAIQSAGAGDEVIVMPGTYGSLGSEITVPQNDIYVHGEDGHPRPVLNFATSDEPTIGLTHSGDRLSNVETFNSGGSGVDVEAGTSADHVVSRVTITVGEDACIANGTLTDSVCSIGPSGPNAAIAVGAPSGTLTAVIRNVTAESAGSSPAGYGLEVTASGGAHVTANVTNTIIHGNTDVYTANDVSSPVTVNLDHSNFATTDSSHGGTINPGAGHQTAAPVFSDSSFHEAPSSPTIDAGVNDPANGSTDIDGDPRTLGAATDIGADEFQPPPSGGGNSGPGQPAQPPALTPFVDSFTGVVLKGQTVVVKNGVAPVAVGCPAGTPGGCTGTLVLTTANRVLARAAAKKKKKKLTLGKATFAIPAGQTKKVNVKITKAGLRLLKHAKVKALANASARDAAATSKSTSARVTLRLGKKKKHH